MPKLTATSSLVCFVYFFLTLAGAFAGGCTSKSTQDVVELINYTYSPEWKGYYKVRSKTDWDTARMNCEYEEAILATPYTLRQTKMLQNLIKSIDLPCGIYIGARRTKLEAQYFTLEDVPLCQVPHQFADKRPNSNEPETCLVMLPNGTLADEHCMKHKPYMCFKKTNPCNSCFNLCKTSDSGYKIDQRTASCYKFYPNATTWGNAVQTCANEGAHLVIINSDVESRILKEIFARYPPEKIYGATRTDAIHVGFHDLFQKNCWRNIDGISLRGSGFNEWAPHQPDNAGKGQDCGSIYRNGLLNDIACKDKLAFVCEIDTTPVGI